MRHWMEIMGDRTGDGPAVLVFSGDYKPLTGGVAEHAYKVACVLRRKGYRVIVLAPRTSGADEFDREAGFITYRVNTHPVWAGLEYLPVLMKIIREHRVKWVYATTANPCAMICAVARAFARFRYSVTIHGHELTYGCGNLRQTVKAFLKPFYTLVLKKADRVFAVSEFTRGSILRSGIEPGKVQSIYNGIDLEDFRGHWDTGGLRARYGLEDKRMLLTVATLDVRKGHDVVIQALPAIIERVPGLVYVVVGGGPNENHLKRLAGSLGVAERVVFTGSVSRQEVIAAIAACDVFAMVSRQVGTNVEGFGIVFLEAGALRKPVVGGRSGGIPDAVEDGVTGLLVDPHSPGEVADAVAGIMLDPALARRLGEAGYERTARLFTWDAVAERIFESVGTL